MTTLIWDAEGQKLYETGVDRGVLYKYDKEKKAYGEGVPWNGLTGVTSAPSGAEPSALYADNIKYANMMSAEEYGATIEAYTYPDEFAMCDGSYEIRGLFLGQQKRSTFAFSWRTRIGNDTDGDDYGYRIHIVYGALAQPSEKSYATVNDSPEAITFSWTVSTTPVSVSNINGVPMRPTAYVALDSTKVDKDTLKKIEDKLYGTEGEKATLILPNELASMITGVAASEEGEPKAQESL